jgi:hypothetical protein
MGAAALSFALQADVDGVWQVLPLSSRGNGEQGTLSCCNTDHWEISSL